MLSFIEIAVTDRRDCPHFDVNPNSGEPESKADHPRIAENRIAVDSSRPSHLALPIIP
jgi:predicted acyl esterase